MFAKPPLLSKKFVLCAFLLAWFLTMVLAAVRIQSGFAKNVEFRHLLQSIGCDKLSHAVHAGVSALSWSVLLLAIGPILGTILSRGSLIRGLIPIIASLIIVVGLLTTSLHGFHNAVIKDSRSWRIDPQGSCGIELYEALRRCDGAAGCFVTTHAGKSYLFIAPGDVTRKDRMLEHICKPNGAAQKADASVLEERR